MGLLFIDSFDHCDPRALRPNGAENMGYNKAAYANTCTMVDGRRASSKALSYGCNHTRTEVAFTKSLATKKTALIAGCAIKISALPASANMPLLYIENDNGQRHEIRVNTDGLLEIAKYDGSTYTRIGYTWAQLTPNTWRYMELRVTEGSGTGSVELRMDGVSVLTVTSITVTTGTRLLKAGVCSKSSTTAQNMTITFDDFYLIDTTGSVNNTFLGDVRVDVLRPTGAGSSTEWTPTGSANNWETVNDVYPDEADYVSTAVGGNEDLYVMSDLPSMSTPTVLGAQSVLLANKSDAGASTVQSIVKSGAGTYGGNTITLAVDPQYYLNIFETNPDGSVAWTEATLNAAEFGVNAL